VSGFLITLEGGEGSGKSTQIDLLASRLRKRGFDTRTAREPGATALGERVRELTRQIPAAPLAELFLFEAARAQLVVDVLVPILASGAIVILDRFFDSTLAYQGYGRGLDPDEIQRVNEIATRGVYPDLTILLDLDVDTGLARKLGEIGQDAIGKEHRDFHERVRSGYLKMAGQEPDRWVVLDATLSPARLSERIWETVQNRLPLAIAKTPSGAI
jgi:dTMP kinase